LVAPLRLGWTGVRRLFEVAGEVDRHLELALPGQPFWYLNNMVVRKHLRGTGVGSRLLREQLPVVAGIEPGFAIALATQRPENVTFYQRLGFQTVLSETIGSGPRAFRNWIMVVSPAAA
jgi:GNAT superfamily N-acetyltransferase